MNKIHDIEDLLCLNHLQKLRDLVLTGNQIHIDKDQYRKSVLRYIPWIRYLDNVKVSQEDIPDEGTVPKTDVDSIGTMCNVLHKDEKDCTHPLESIIVDLSYEISRYDMTVHVQPIINKMWDLTNEYLTNMLELNDIFISQINLFKDIDLAALRFLFLRHRNRLCGKSIKILNKVG